MKSIKIILYISIFCFFVFVLGVGFICYGLYEIYMPFGSSLSSEQTKLVMVQKGQSVKEIGQNLANENLIRSQFWFEVDVWLEKSGNRLQAGQYEIGSSSSIAQIVKMLAQGDVLENYIQVTFPEGFSAKEIESKLLESGIAAAKDLDKASIDEFQLKYQFLGDAPKKANLEGFLFPDTYKFEKDASQQEIIQKILDNFDAKISAQMRQDILSQGKNIFEIVTMASIIEKEGKTAADRKIIAGIFWERLADKYPLESDATLSYVFNDKNSRHSLEQTKIDSPYNTYKYAGLPPGPISNPGVEAIEAAIYPEQSNYYFFLTKPDTGEAVFAKTLEEQSTNKAKYLK